MGGSSGIEVWFGRALDGDSLLPQGDRLGALCRGPGGLLHDLELRLGLAQPTPSHGVRVARYGARLAALAPRGRFYTASHATDPWGTAEELLGWRDQLLEAGWNGAALPDTGPRVAALAELEGLADAAPVPGVPDRLIAVADALARRRSAPYDAVHLVEPRAEHAPRWQAIFDGLEKLGATIDEVVLTSQLAPAETDLGRLQRHLEHGGDAVPPRGDGSLWLLRAETVFEAAHATANLARAFVADGDQLALIRPTELQPLEHALVSAGLQRQGASSTHRLRPILQVASLALELAFEPKDPRRVLELLALHDGPFRGLERRFFTEAIAKMPGLGNEAWEKAKQRFTERLREKAEEREEAEADVEAEVARRLARVHDWIEAPGSPVSGAPRERLIEVVARVRRWLQGRLVNLTRGQEDQEERSAELERVGMALGHVAGLGDALAADSRASLSLVQVRQLVEATLGQGASVTLGIEQADRLDFVDAPAALLAPRDTVLWWGCLADGAESPARIPFDRAEREALARHGVRLPDPHRELARLAHGWRRALRMASRRLALVAPRFVREEEAAVHPIWDELTARLGGKREDLARVSLDAAALRTDAPSPKLPRLAVAAHPARSLPAARTEWKVNCHGPIEHLSATSIESLVGCPLRFVLDVKAGLRPSALRAVPEGPILYGTLGHRLVEKLHRERAFSLSPEALHARAEALLDMLLPQEAAPLLLPGQRGELVQVRAQLVRSVARLAELLREAGLEIAEVEKDERATWRGAELAGRLDVLLVDSHARDVVLDLKWGRATYEDKLRAGGAIQLAVYAWLRRQATKAEAFPAVAYFSLSRGVALSTDGRTFRGAKIVEGDDIEVTFQRLERTVALVDKKLSHGLVPVSGVSRGRPTAEACGGVPADPSHLPLAPDAACGYCEHDAICGRRWEVRS